MRVRRRAWVIVAVAAASSIGLTTILTIRTADPPGSSPNEPAIGGTLRVAVLDASLRIFATSLDPQRAYWSVPWELYRCCLLRTLLSYNGHPTDQDGSRLFPDLAEEIPSISSDGLAWTFRLKEGIRYGPPLEETTIVAQDFIRAIEREAPLSPTKSYSFYYSVIEGFDDFVSGRVDAITGLEAPDARTLIVRLNEPASDLGYRLSLPATAPIPPLPDGSAMGAATGHKDYSRFLVSSGPYMFEGSERLDFTAPPHEQEPVSGYVPGQSMTLVRNPSWSRSTDHLRGAFVDRIEIAIRRSEAKDWRRVESGQLDLVFDASPPPEVMAAYREDRSLTDQLRGNSDNFIAGVSINLAVPPFDDIHVRRALNWAIDKARLVRILSQTPSFLFGHLYGSEAGHLVPDSLEGNLLQGQHIYPTRRSAGSVASAKREMARSRYDVDQDGVCDAPVCKEVLALTQDGPFAPMGASIARDLEPIGITLRVRSMSIGDMFEQLQKPKAKVPLGLGAGWQADYPVASQSFTGQFTASGRGNVTNIGIAPEQLRKWGYEAAHVPNVDDRIDRCLNTSEPEQLSCWASLDQYLMSKVTPFVPYVFFTQFRTLSARVTRFAFDQFTGLPALDQIALNPDSSN